MTAGLPDWMYAPRLAGWYADDLDGLSEAPPHTELIHGAFVFTLFPQGAWHARIVDALLLVLEGAAPAGIRVERETAIRLDERNRVEADLVVVTVSDEAGRTFLTPDQVLLVVEVVSPESAHRDRTVKLRKYAEAGIRHYWRVEDESEDASPVVHTYEIDGATGSYAPTGIHRRVLNVRAPYPITIDLG